MKKLFISLCLLCGLSLPSCDKAQDAPEVTEQSDQVASGEINLNLQIGIEEQEDLRSLELTSTMGKPLLSAMQEGQEVEVHLFFSNKTNTTYAKRNFKLKDGHLKLVDGKISLRGYTNDQDTRDWYVTGYIGGTPTNTTPTNTGLTFEGARTFAHIAEGEKVKLATPYAFAWTKFKMTQLADINTNPLLSGIKFKPQGTLLRLKFSYTPTAAPYPYKLKSFKLVPASVSNLASVSYSQPTEGGFMSLVPSTNSLGATSIEASDATLTSGQTTGNYWMWIAGKTGAKFKLELTGEPVYPTSGHVIKSLLTTTATGDISLANTGGRSPSYNIKFNPERPLLPIEFMAEGDANGNGSEVAGNGFNPGGIYQEGSLPTPKNNRYAPTDYDLTSVLFSSKPDASYNTSDYSTWISMYSVGHNYETENIIRAENIRMLEGYSGSSLFKYNNSLNTRLQATQGVRVTYGLRLIGDGNKRLSAWRYEYVVDKGIKIEAVYLGPKWEHLADIESKQALRHITNEAWWDKHRTNGDVITRYLNVKDGLLANVISDTPKLGRYFTTGGSTYKYVEFNATTQVYKGNTYKSYILNAKKKAVRDGYIRYFRINPYLD